jgi:hypothetical protein
MLLMYSALNERKRVAGIVPRNPPVQAGGPPFGQVRAASQRSGCPFEMAPQPA